MPASSPSYNPNVRPVLVGSQAHLLTVTLNGKATVLGLFNTYASALTALLRFVAERSAWKPEPLGTPAPWDIPAVLDAFFSGEHDSWAMDAHVIAGSLLDQR